MLIIVVRIFDTKVKKNLLLKYMYVIATQKCQNWPIIDVQDTLTD